MMMLRRPLPFLRGSGVRQRARVLSGTAERLRLLLAASSYEDEEKKNGKVARGMGLAGALGLLGGATTLLYAHSAELVALMESMPVDPADAVGVSLLATGVTLCGCAAVVSAGPLSAPRRKWTSTAAPWKKKRLLRSLFQGDDDGDDERSALTDFKFTLLNSDDALASASSALRDLVPPPSLRALPQDLRDRIKACAEKTKKRRREARDGRLKGAAEFAAGMLATEDASASDEEGREGGADADGAAAVRAGLRPRCFVADFDSSKKPIRTAVRELEAVVAFLEREATRHDEFVLRVASPGGGVSDYGLAAATLARLKKKATTPTGSNQLKRVTACVDVVAASGGYMLAAVADRIVAAPFAFVGSIGVVAGLPNFKRVLDKNDVDFLLFTAGKHKRTVTVLGDVTDEGRAKFQAELDDVHRAFKRHVDDHRRDLSIDDVATGEAWLAALAPPGLVDDLATSGEVLRDAMPDFDVILVEAALSRPQSPLKRLLQGTLDLFRASSQPLHHLAGLGAAAGPHQQIRLHAPAAASDPTTPIPVLLHQRQASPFTELTTRLH